METFPVRTISAIPPGRSSICDQPAPRSVRFPILGRIWTTTTQETADRVLKDSEAFSMRREDGYIAGVRWWMPGIVRTLANHMQSMDEPDHRRLRDIVDEAFRRRAI